MILAFIAHLTASQSALFLLCILLVCIFEAINGFHDTANAVATVIYTKTLKPQVAVIYSGLLNFAGVMLGGLAVAMGVIKLVPLNDMMAAGLNENIAMALAILLTAILWNLATWYKGIPCSSSHTLIGALIGAGYGFYVVHGGSGPNWEKAKDIGLSLLISPLFGFALSILMMYIFRLLFKKKSEIFSAPKKKTESPGWIKAMLIGTCGLVSYFHGNNDGQKGVGLLLVVLIAFIPSYFALNPNVSSAEMATNLRKIETQLRLAAANSNQLDYYGHQADETAHLAVQLDTLNHDDDAAVFAARKGMQNLKKKLDSDIKAQVIVGETQKNLKAELKSLANGYEFAPTWAIAIIAVCLGLGTMVGWKRIVVTIGEKIGKTHLTYAQGASAELCAAATIGVSSSFGLPVSTTHVLSSGIAGSMVASGGVGNLQKSTISSMAIAWILTLPITLLGAFSLYFLFRAIL